MELIILVMMIIVISSWTIWLRYFYFIRGPKFNCKLIPGVVKSPAEGTIVYLKRDLTRKDITICKSEELYGNRLFKMDKQLTEDKYAQLGIYMTIYDCHHVVTQIDSKIKSINCLGDNNTCPMMVYIDQLLGIFGFSFLNWINKSEKFIHYNQQYVIEYMNGIIVVITMDKFVNKFDYEIRNGYNFGYILGFVHRGSQTDIFIPERLQPKFLVQKYSKVSYDTELCKLGDLN